MGIFGIGRKKPKRGTLTALVDKQQARELRESLARERREKKAGELKCRTEKLKAETSCYKAKAEKKKAKKSASFQWAKPPAVKVKIRKKKQGGKLSRKRPIRLI